MKTGKKFLSVLLSMLIIMTSCVTAISSFAADEIREEDGHRYKVSLEVAATCEAAGFKVWSCIDDGCNSSYMEETEPKLGHIWVAYTLEPTCDEMGYEGRRCDREGCGEIELDTEKYIPSLGHDWSAWGFAGQEPDGNNVPTYYYNTRNCGRDGCGEVEFEKDGESIVKYYKVDFVNEWVAKKYYYAEDDTKLAYDEWTSEYYNVDTKTYFVKENGNANVYDGNKPSRAKTEAYGEYKFTGWKAGDVLCPATAELEAYTITENTTFKAQFKGQVKEYTVIFYGYENVQNPPSELGNYTYVHVNHGDTITYNPARCLVPVSSDTDMRYNYYFNGWNLKYVPETEKPLVENPNENYQYGDAVTTVKIYDNHSVRPAFETVPKQYKVIFHDPNGNIIYLNDGNEKINGVVFGYGESVVASAPVFDLNQPPFSNDPAYYYEFGTANFRQYRWKYADGTFADISALSVPNGTAEYDPVCEENEWMNDEDKGIIHLYPNIVRLAKYYTIELTVLDIDGYTPAKGATVQVTDIVGEGEAAHLIGSRYTVGANGKVTLSVPYGTSAGGFDMGVYQVTATLDGRTVVGVITEAVMENAVAGNGTLTLVLQEPEGDEADKGCTCICHSFFGKIYITLLNIIYKITGRKIVCCYDMYIRHGDDLAYGQ